MKKIITLLSLSLVYSPTHAQNENAGMSGAFTALETKYKEANLKKNELKNHLNSLRSGSSELNEEERNQANTLGQRLGQIENRIRNFETNALQGKSFEQFRQEKVLQLQKDLAQRRTAGQADLAQQDAAAIRDAYRQGDRCTYAENDRVKLLRPGVGGADRALQQEATIIKVNNCNSYEVSIDKGALIDHNEIITADLIIAKIDSARDNKELRDVAGANADAALTSAASYNQKAQKANERNEQVANFQRQLQELENAVRSACGEINSAHQARIQLGMDLKTKDYDNTEWQQGIQQYYQTILVTRSRHGIEAIYQQSINLSKQLFSVPGYPNPQILPLTYCEQLRGDDPLKSFFDRLKVNGPTANCLYMMATGLEEATTSSEAHLNIKGTPFKGFIECQ